MPDNFLRVHPDDDMLVALVDSPRGEVLASAGGRLQLLEDIPAKHKVLTRDVRRGERLRMYGITVAEATRDLRAGQLLTTQNVVHSTDPPGRAAAVRRWTPPDVSAWREATFEGYHRSDGRVGTRNYWIVLPLVFCENRNLRVMREALLEELGYAPPPHYQQFVRELIDRHRSGDSLSEFQETPWRPAEHAQASPAIFPNVDGIKFLSHDGGCGGAYGDAMTLCGLLAGYLNHPNVAGGTVLSLGCQKAQIENLRAELRRRNPNFDKPLGIFEQQQLGTEQALISEALQFTFQGLVEADRARRAPAPVAQLTLGLECGGSDGFSGISANPAVGHCSDLLVACGGSVILSEFPELAGCEQELADRCVDQATAERFLQIMRHYEQRVMAEGNGFDTNPSPGNIRDGLITDAIKSAGAARKGGTSPITDVLDYPEPVTASGLNLLCTPGGDVESTTAMAGSGATVMLFTTGLGTPTGNPVAPVLKVASNSPVAKRMPDVIDLDAGGVITGQATIAEIGQRLFECVIATASGEERTCAERLGQDDFIPWKRGTSL